MTVFVGFEGVYSMMGILFIDQVLRHENTPLVSWTGNNHGKHHVEAGSCDPRLCLSGEIYYVIDGEMKQAAGQ